MTEYFAYTRVSTARQGDGVSLQEQKEAIVRYAAKENITIKEWFEERVTAAKIGRRAFNQMLSRARRGQVAGIIVHKLDRSARNLKDWSRLGELVDQGLEFRIAHENIDLNTRGGRLSADLQAVIAADFIRNLREETRKGFYGRLKQGFYPLRAPIGYLDNGGGKVKTHDPTRAPLIKTMFELYASGAYTLNSLAEKMEELGFQALTGRVHSGKQLSKILNNPFYAGIIRIKKSNETFAGRHKPIVNQALFDRVRDILQSRTPRRNYRHAFLFPRLIACSLCGQSVIGERQKGHVYYRCHAKACRGACIRESVVEDFIAQRFKSIQIPKYLADDVRQQLPKYEVEAARSQAGAIKAIRLAIKNDEARIERMIDALVDDILSKDAYEERRSKLLISLNSKRQELAILERQESDFYRRMHQNIELWESLYSSYISAERDEKREIVMNATSNRVLNGKNLSIELQEPYVTLENAMKKARCDQHRPLGRTLLALLVDISKSQGGIDIERDAFDQN